MLSVSVDIEHQPSKTNKRTSAFEISKVSKPARATIKKDSTTTRKRNRELFNGLPPPAYAVIMPVLRNVTQRQGKQFPARPDMVKQHNVHRHFARVV